MGGIYGLTTTERKTKRDRCWSLSAISCDSSSTLIIAYTTSTTTTTATATTTMMMANDNKFNPTQQQRLLSSIIIVAIINEANYDSSTEIEREREKYSTDTTS